MLTRKLTVTFSAGLHARPATEFVRMLKSFESSVTVRKNDATANAKSLVKLLKLGIVQGDTLFFDFDGSDEQAVADEVERFFARTEI